MVVIFDGTMQDAQRWKSSHCSPRILLAFRTIDQFFWDNETSYA
jgi:hypothetical protein